jgi:hypothetical protein
LSGYGTAPFFLAKKQSRIAHHALPIIGKTYFLLFAQQASKPNQHRHNAPSAAKTTSPIPEWLFFPQIPGSL